VILNDLGTWEIFTCSSRFLFHTISNLYTWLVDLAAVVRNKGTVCAICVEVTVPVFVPFFYYYGCIIDQWSTVSIKSIVNYIKPCQKKRTVNQNT
jgi:hypothetical protein